MALRSGPTIEYLLKETSFGTCDNRFFGWLEKEMLQPNNVNVYGRIRNASSLDGHTLRLEFPGETMIGYLKSPVSNRIEEGKRILTYNLDQLVNYEDTWWLPLDGETEFGLSLNLLPPFPKISPVDLSMECKPEVATGLEANVRTSLRIQAEEPIDRIFLRFSAPFSIPGVSMAITEFSADTVTAPRPSVTLPAKQFPFPRMSLGKGQVLNYTVNTKISSNTANMSTLRCQQDILSTRLLFMSDSIGDGPPCKVSIQNKEGITLPILKTVRSTVLQANAQVMYSPFTIKLEQLPRPERPVITAAA